MRWKCPSRWAVNRFRSNVLQYEAPVTLLRSIHTSAIVPSSPVRTRFAPSPTGNLHLGSIRTALFNYLIAKRTGGQFLLRIEDTDQKRTVPGAEERLFDDLHWAGISWDEGPLVGGPHGPYRQSERVNTYHDNANTLVQSGAAYRCFCDAKRLDTLARSRNERGLAPGYDRKCYDIASPESDQRAQDGQGHVIRLRAPDEFPQFDDLVYGRTGNGPQAKRNLYTDDAAYQDPVLMKSDGFPTYHFANVVDDHLMNITHVIRGCEWMPSTPLHMALYKAFGWTPPHFAHVALLVDAKGQKLSKRDKASDMSFYRGKDGVFPDTLANFAALLGWSHRRKSDVMRLDELAEEFSLKFTKGNVTVALEKLWYLQQRHALRVIRDAGVQFENIVDEMHQVVLEAYPSPEIFEPKTPDQQRSILSMLLRADGKNYRTPAGFTSSNANFFKSLPRLSPYEQTDPEIPLAALRTAASALTLVPATQWTTENHAGNITSHAGLMSPEKSSSLPDLTENSQAQNDSLKRWRKEFYHYMRWALLAGANGPGIADTMTILGRDLAVKRIREAIKVTMGMEQERNLGRTGRTPKIEPHRLEDFNSIM